MIEQFYAYRYGDNSITNQEYIALQDRWLTLADQLSKGLPFEQSELLQQIMDLRDQCVELAMQESYATGLKDGATLMTEIWNNGK